MAIHKYHKKTVKVTTKKAGSKKRTVKIKKYK